MTSRDQLLTFLGNLGFRTGKGSASPYGQPLPLVSGWAFDEGTAIVALLVEDPEHIHNPEVWRELLFALSGLRHELRRGRSAALGPPAVFALLADQGEARRLHALVEDLTRQYLLFSRVELNAVVLSDGDMDPYRALAPLLPRCRDAVNSQIVLSHELLDSLSGQLRDEVSLLADRIDPTLSSRGRGIANEYSVRLANLLRVGSSSRWPPMEAWRRLTLTEFRSFASAAIELREVTLLEGLNGTGKSSILEALEILWSGTSQRKPVDGDAKVFDQHLGRNGAVGWSIAGSAGDNGRQDKTVGVTEPSADAIRLARNVLSQDSPIDVARESRAERYAELLRMTGLAVPELLVESEKINREAKSQVDRVLSRLNVEPLRAISVRAVDHVRNSLTGAASFEFPSDDAVRNAESNVDARIKALGLAYRGTDMTAGSAALDRLTAFRQLATSLAENLLSSDELVSLGRQIHKDLEDQADECDRKASALDALAAQFVGQEITVNMPPRELKPAELSAPLALTWLNTGLALRHSVEDLRRLGGQLQAGRWRQRLDDFLLRAEALVVSIPYEDLEDASRRPTSTSPSQRRSIDLRVLTEAGLSDTTLQGMPSELQPAMAGLAQVLRIYSAELKGAAKEILNSPLVRLRGVEDDLHNALARFEMARQLRAPLTQAQERLLNDLIKGPLEPVLAELISALTRFEWYFHPFEMTISRGQVRFGGLAVPPGAGLDVRMLLNTGERAIVTIAWFLALHILQRPESRTVLVLDDPFSQLDENNQAALLATLRVVTRLTRPQLVVLTCHERVLADTVEREFASVEGWPSDLVRLRCSRNSNGESTIELVPPEAPAGDLAAEIRRFGLGTEEDLSIAQMT